MSPARAPRNHRCRGAGLLFLALLFLPRVSSGQCPASSVSCVGKDVVGQVQFDVHDTSTDPVDGVSYNRSLAEYDLRTGTISAVAIVDNVNSHTSEVVAVDRFLIQNAAAATLTVRLSINMNLVTDPSARMAWAGASAQLAVGGQTATAESYGPHIDPFIELQVDVVAGEPFEVTYEALAWGSGYYPTASMDCQLSFVGVPEGAHITSCNGFGDLGVPVEATTWGQIKSMYR